MTNSVGLNLFFSQTAWGIKTWMVPCRHKLSLSPLIIVYQKQTRLRSLTWILSRWFAVTCFKCLILLGIGKKFLWLVFVIDIFKIYFKIKFLYWRHQNRNFMNTYFKDMKLHCAKHLTLYSAQVHGAFLLISNIHVDVTLKVLTYSYHESSELAVCPLLLGQ